MTSESSKRRDYLALAKQYLSNSKHFVLIDYGFWPSFHPNTIVYGLWSSFHPKIIVYGFGSNLHPNTINWILV